MAGDDELRLQALDHIERGRYFVKGRNAFNLGEDHTKTVFPQRIGGDECAAFGLEQNHRMGVMSGRPMNLPVAP